MIPLPSRLHLEALAIAGALAFGWYCRGVYQGYLDNEAAKAVVDLHVERVERDESAGLMFGATLDSVSLTTSTTLTEVARADLKPRTITVFVDKPGEMECPVRSQFTPDFLRLWNGEAAQPADADGGVREVRAGPATPP